MDSTITGSVNTRCQLTIKMIKYVGVRPLLSEQKGPRGRMVVRFTTNCAVSVYHHWNYEFESY